MRVIVKISGEVLKEDNNICDSMLKKVLDDVRLLKNNNYDVILVVGGGNFWRGRNNLDIDSTISDQIGMLATIMNSLAINNYLNNNGIISNVFSAFEVDGIVKKYNEYDVLKALRKNKVIVLGGGLGIPNFSTDMVTIEKAIQLKADMIIMAKNIDGIYDKDPKLEGAVKKDEITHQELLINQINVGIEKQGVMDFEALATLAKHRIPLYLYSAKDKEGLQSIIDGKNKGTTVITR